MPPRLARLLAVVVAAGLVAGAFAVRGALADDEDETVSAGTGRDPAVQEEGSFQVLCDADLGEDVCAAVEGLDRVDDVQVVTADEVLDAAAAEELAAYDAWLTLDPMPSVVDTARSVDDLPPLTAEGARAEVASATLGVLTAETSPLECGDPVDWGCLVEPVRPGVAIPGPATSIGTVSLAAGAAALLGTTDFGIDQFRSSSASDELADLLDDVEGAAGSTTRRQTDSMLNPGTASAAITTTALARSRADTIRGRDRGLVVLPLLPEVVVGVVLVGLGSAGEDAVLALEEGVLDQTVAEALGAAGWDGRPATSTGLPDPDVIYALRERLA